MSAVSKQEEKRSEVRFVLSNIVNKAHKCSQVTGVSERTIYRLKARLKNGLGVKRLPGSGRPRKVDDTGRRAIGRIIQADPRLSNEKIAARLQKSSPITVSRFTIARELNHLNISRFKPEYRPVLTAKHIAARLEFCLENRQRNWTKTVFSDEAMFQFYSNSCKLLGKERPVLERPKYTPKIMIWRGIAERGKTPLKFCRKIMNSDEYIETIDGYLLTTMSTLYPDGFIFQQDNAPCHVSKKTREFLENSDIPVLKWPANSPDLNPIENVWGLMKTHLSKKVITNMAQLEREIELIWEGFSHEYLSSLVNSMKTRIEMCIEAEGRHIPY